MKGIEVISFDVGFTLIHPHPPVGKVYSMIAAKYGYPADADQVNSRFLKAWQRKTRDNQSAGPSHPLADEATAYCWWHEVFRQSIGDSIPEHCLEIIFKECFYEYGRGKYWRIYTDVPPALQRLHKKYTLVVLSNWDLRLQQTLWELQLTPYFKNIYISTQIGFAKPQQRAFLHMVNDLGIDPRSVLHVGDSLVEDYRAAASAGLKSLHLKRAQKGDRHQENFQISSLHQLLL
jgi:putative hydrolase of the HAD superfamily